MTDELITNKIFSEKNTVSIIMFLHIFGPKTRSEIYKAVSTNPRMPIKLELLESYGIIRTLESDTNYRRMMILTPLGRKYATTLCNLEKLSGGSIDMFKWDVVRNMLDENKKAEA